MEQAKRPTPAYEGGQIIMMRSMFAGVAGLRNHQLRLDVIGANIANVNTVGFKRSRVTFKDTMYQQMQGAAAPRDNRGGINPMQVGLGMQVASADVIHTSSSPQSTGKTTDLCIQGDGYFITGDGLNRYYTRAGTFDFDPTGNYYNMSNGQLVMGYMADLETGLINSTSDPVPIKITGDYQISAPKATEKTTLTGNIDLSLDQKVLPKSMTKTVFDSLGRAHSLEFRFDRDNVNLFGNLDPAAPPAAATSVKVKDSAGNEVDLELTFTPPAAPGSDQWTVSFAGSGGETITPGTTTIDFNHLERFDLAVSGGVLTEEVTLTLDPRSLTQTSTAGSSTVNASTHHGPGGWNITTFFNNLPTNGVDTDSEAIAFTDTGLVVYDAVNPAIFTIPTQTIPGPPPAEDLNITVDFHGLTLYDAEWTAWPETQDGYAEGELRSYSIDNTGTIIGSYSNGQTQNIAQVALATFQNPAGLQLIGENMYAQSVNSGDANPSAPGVGGKGFIVPGALEMSNVDLAQEFTDMIITQRGFQANSRIISTSDEMLQELVNLKR